MNARALLAPSAWKANAPSFKNGHRDVAEHGRDYDEVFPDEDMVDDNNNNVVATT